MDRRSFLLAAGASFVGTLPGIGAERLEATPSLLTSAFRDKSGSFGVAVFDAIGNIIWQTALPARGHAVVKGETGRLSVVFARRPGNFGLAFDPIRRRPNVLFHTPANRHFYGHGVFSLDGKLLFATENDFENGAGKIGIYDAGGSFLRLGEFDSFGTGPHDLLMMPDGKTLCVANGGIETHPDFARTKLNIASMEPSIAFIDSKDGSLISQIGMPERFHKLSTRHMDVSSDGTVWVGCQYQGDKSDLPPLVWRLPGNTGELEAAQLPKRVTARLASYVGSICYSQHAGTLIATSPKGNCAVELDATSGQLITLHGQNSVCGVTVHNRQWQLSGLDGSLNDGMTPYNWDNHLSTLSV